MARRTSLMLKGYCLLFIIRCSVNGPSTTTIFIFHDADGQPASVDCAAYKDYEEYFGNISEGDPYVGYNNKAVWDYDNPGHTPCEMDVIDIITLVDGEEVDLGEITLNNADPYIFPDPDVVVANLICLSTYTFMLGCGDTCHACY